MYILLSKKFDCVKEMTNMRYGLDKRVVVKLVVNVALDCPGVGFHLQKQHILIIFKSFAAQPFRPLCFGFYTALSLYISAS